MSDDPIIIRTQTFQLTAQEWHHAWRAHMLRSARRIRWGLYLAYGVGAWFLVVAFRSSDSLPGMVLAALTWGIATYFVRFFRNVRRDSLAPPDDADPFPAVTYGFSQNALFVMWPDGSQERFTVRWRTDAIQGDSYFQIVAKKTRVAIPFRAFESPDDLARIKHLLQQHNVPVWD